MTFLSQDTGRLVKIFTDNLLSSNRGFNYYVDWSNITNSDYHQYLVEIHAMDVLIGCKDDGLFIQRFVDLLGKLPNVVLLFPAHHPISVANYL